MKHGFVKLIDKYEGDLNRAGYEFIGITALNKTKTTPKASVINDLVKFYSGNMGHSAFEILASHEYDDYFNDVYQDGEVFEVHSDLLNKFTPVENKSNINKVSEAIRSIYDNSTRGSKNGKRGKDINKKFFENLEKLYKNFSPNTMKADIACAYFQQNSTTDGADYAVDLLELNNEDDGEGPSNIVSYADTIVNEGEDSSHAYTPLVNNVYSSIVRAPFIDPIAKSNMPLLPTTCYRKRGRMYGGDENGDDKPKAETSKTESVNEDEDENLLAVEDDDDNTIKMNARKKNKKKGSTTSKSSPKHDKIELDDAEDDVDKGFSIDFFK
jgi:hypothetical protein